MILFVYLRFEVIFFLVALSCSDVLLVFGV
jgi:hypothetical protein